MTLVAHRVADSRTQQLKALIEILVDVVKAHGGTVSQREAMREKFHRPRGIYLRGGRFSRRGIRG